MDTLSTDVLGNIIILLDPKSYANFIISYRGANEWFNQPINRKNYKSLFLQKVKIISTDFVEKYTIIKDIAKKHGKYKKYAILEGDRKLAIVSHYHRGLKCGKHIEYFSNGKIYVKTTYLNNKICGNYRQFYDDGNLCFEALYMDGSIVGKFTMYDNTGKIIQEGHSYQNAHK